MDKSKAPDLRSSALVGTKIPQWTVENKRMTSKLAQWVKALTARPENLNLIPRTYVVGGEKWILHVVLWLPLTNLWCSPPHGHGQISGYG